MKSQQKLKTLNPDDYAWMFYYGNAVVRGLVSFTILIGFYYVMLAFTGWNFIVLLIIAFLLATAISPLINKVNYGNQLVWKYLALLDKIILKMGKK